RRLDTPFVFPDCGTGRKLSHRFPVWVKAGALPTEGPDKVTFHTLRHTFASRLVMGGVDLLTVQKLGGWGSLSMVQRYAHLAPAPGQGGVEARARGVRLPTATATATAAEASVNATLTGRG